jgi:hypothetical protein
MASAQTTVPNVDFGDIPSVGFTTAKGVGPREIPPLETLFEVISEISSHLGRFVWAEDGQGIRWTIASWHDEASDEIIRGAYLEIHWRHGQLLADEVCPDRHFVDVDRNILDTVAAASQCCRRHGIPIQVFVTG